MINEISFERGINVGEILKREIVKYPKLLKSPIGIEGLDDITEGGIPKGRTTLITGGAGTGKTLLSISYLINGVDKFNETGVFMSFAESEIELQENVASMNIDLKKYSNDKKINVEYVKLDRNEFEEIGKYNLDGIFIRLGFAIDSIKATRVVLDTIESLFDGLNDISLIRSELKRLFQWLKDRKVTAIISAEIGEGIISRFGIEEYVADCVIFLDHRIVEQISTRRIRIVKYRGTTHGTNEYPFVIDSTGISVLPITTLELNHHAITDKISSGIPDLDKMFAHIGFGKTSSIMVSGSTGTGKTSFAAAFAIETCKRGEKCLFLSFEESPEQLIQNMKSIGFNFAPWVDNKLLFLVSTRPTFFGLEMHLLNLYKNIELIQPSTVIVDPVTSLLSQGTGLEIQSMLTRMSDLFRSKGITSFFASLLSDLNEIDSGEIISSIMDTWIVLRNTELKNHKRVRNLYIRKSRGSSHYSNVASFTLSANGISIKATDEFENKKLLNFNKIQIENKQNKDLH
jgi:circadian clock protein KaiC